MSQTALLQAKLAQIAARAGDFDPEATYEDFLVIMIPVKELLDR